MTTNVFLFGTLCWEPLLMRVAGNSCPRPKSAQLPGYHVSWAKGHAFPAIHARADGVADGILLTGCSDEILKRMDHYESGFSYTLHTVTVISDGVEITAQVYLPPDGIDTGPRWDLSDWVQDHGAVSLEAAVEVMDGFGQMNAKDMAARYPMVRVRADARLNARANPSPKSDSGLTAADVMQDSHRRPYTNFFAIEECDLRVPRFSGGEGLHMSRGVFVGSDAAIVLPYDPVRDRVLLIEQFRAAPYLRADPNPWMMEPIAGRIDPGELPETAAKREAREEAGLKLSKLHFAHKGYASPGCSTEYFHIFVGIADLPDSSAKLGGLPCENEDIKGHLVDYVTFAKNLSVGHYPVTPLALAGFWLMAHRDALRHPA